MDKNKADLVVKSNSLVQASYRLTLVEQQLILYTICSSRRHGFGFSADKPVTIYAVDFARQFGLHEDNVYGQLKDSIATLFGRFVTIQDIDPDSGKKRVTETRWISDQSYIDGAGKVQVTFAPKIIPFISMLEKEFTTYRLEQVCNMTSFYALRIYELLIQHVSFGRREIEVKWLRDALCLTNEYERLPDFKKRVVDVAVDQINLHSDIEVAYTQRKAGRTVTHFIFTIEEKKGQERSVKKSSKLEQVKIDRKYVEKHARPGESYEDAFHRLRSELWQQSELPI